jgi:hypothetical protein
MDTVSPRTPKDKPHYTYVLRYPQNYVIQKLASTIFYVGKGTGKRINGHEREARGGIRSHKCSVIRKIWRNGFEVEKEILAYFVTNEEALMHEIALIFFLPGLTNVTPGGQGTLGLTPWNKGLILTKEQKRNIVEANRKIGDKKRGLPGRPVSEATKLKLSEANRNRPPASQETRLKLGIASRNRPIEIRQKQAETLKSNPFYQEMLHGLHESNKGRKRPESTGRKISAARMGHTVSEEQRRRQSASMQWYRPTPETIAKQVASNTGQKRSEEACKRIGDGRRGKGTGKTPWNKGKPMAEEQKAKLRGRKASEQTIQKLRESHKGQVPSNLQQLIEINKNRVYEPVSEVTKQKIKEARAKQVTTDETRRKMSEAQKKRWEAKRNTQNPSQGALIQGHLWEQAF